MRFVRAVNIVVSCTERWTSGAGALWAGYRVSKVNYLMWCTDGGKIMIWFNFDERV